MAENYTFVDPKTGAIWQKVLFHRPRTFPDNFTPDECFLAAIKRNQNLHKYTLQQCFLGATQVGLQMSMVLFFVMAYVALDESSANSNYVLGLAAISSTVGYFWLRFQDTEILSIKSYLKDLQHVSIFLFYSFSFSPVLYKLTDTISTDTIYTTAGIMLFIHLVFHNYGLERAAVVSNALSLNASLFASVCLASRLASSYDAFVLLTFSVVAFVLFPIFRFRLNGMTLLSVALISVPCSILLAAKCYTSSFAAFAALGFIIVIGICPGLFVRWQNFKDTIHHPQWDEAVPNISFFK